jgi:hypothetical protein
MTGVNKDRMILYSCGRGDKEWTVFGERRREPVTAELERPPRCSLRLAGGRA